jgi:hypothetical protein
VVETLETTPQGRHTLVDPVDGPGGMHRGTPGLGSIGRSRRYRLASLVAFWEAVTQAA